MSHYVLYYLVRDADNFKQSDYVRVADDDGGATTLADLSPFLTPDGGFYPSQVGLPALGAECEEHELLALDHYEGGDRDCVGGMSELLTKFASAKRRAWSDPDRFYRTVVVFELLSREPLDGSISALAAEAESGKASGKILSCRAQSVGKEAMRGLLLAHGSDPDFFLRGN